MKYVLFTDLDYSVLRFLAFRISLIKSEMGLWIELLTSISYCTLISRVN